MWINKKNKILHDFLIVSIYLVFARTITAGREIIIAWNYGVSDYTDAFNFTFNLMNWCLGVVMGLFTLILIPQHDKIKSVDARNFRNELVTWTLIAGFFVGAVLYLCADTYLKSNNTTSIEQQELILHFSKFFSYLMPIGAMNIIFSVWMMAQRDHRNTLLEGVAPLGMIFTLIILDTSEYVTLIYGVAVGITLHTVTAYILLDKKLRPDKIRVSITPYYWKMIFKITLIAFLGQFLISTSILIEQHYAWKVGEGAISILSYANRVAFLLIGLVSVAITRSTLPVFSQIATNDKKKFEKILSKLCLIFFTVGVFITIITMSFSNEIISIIYERGSFNPNDTLSVSKTFTALVLQIPMYFSVTVLMSFLISIKQYSKIAIISALGISAKLAFLEIYYSFFELSLEIVAYSNSVLYFVLLIFCMLATYHCLVKIKGAK